ncbi:MAG: addiction module protein [Proteobacteria bacterium]|nr:addiction module protein [Pseudomonadota bacterium]
MLSEAIKKEILDLKAVEKVHLVELILGSLDKPDPQIEEAWINESEQRYKLYKEGKIKAFNSEEVREKLEARWK